jgi:hypothetical protein
MTMRTVKLFYVYPAELSLMGGAWLATHGPHDCGGWTARSLLRARKEVRRQMMAPMSAGEVERLLDLTMQQCIESGLKPAFGICLRHSGSAQTHVCILNSALPHEERARYLADLIEKIASRFRIERTQAHAISLGWDGFAPLTTSHLLFASVGKRLRLKYI